MNTKTQSIDTAAIELIAEYITAIKLSKPGEAATFGFDSFATMESNLQALGLTEEQVALLARAAK
jgi:hypothetical protein